LWCLVSTNVLSFDASSKAFIAMRPSWTLAGSALSLNDGERHLDQTAFRWNEGVWEAEVIVRRDEPAIPWHYVTLRIASDTVRRWAELGINPFIEASAQLKEHLAAVRSAGATSFLTLL
jgi:hypothetical protein